MDDFVNLSRFTGLCPADYVLVLAAVSVLFVIAYFAGRKERDTGDFFLGGRSIPAWVICLSFVATEISAATIVGVPSIGFKEKWHYLQFFIGSAAAKVVLAVLFVPVFYKLDCTTIYQFLRNRFGPGTQYTATCFFFLTRLLGSGVRLFMACQAVACMLGWPLEAALLAFTVGAIILIAFGGIKAVVWNGAYQTIFFYIMGVAVVWFLGSHIHGGLAGALSTAAGAGKLDTFNLNLSFADTKTLYGAFCFSLLSNVAIFGTDQEFMQRMLTANSRRSSQRAMLGTIAVALPLVVIYLCLGTLLWVFYQQNPSLPLPDKADNILPHFALSVLPGGLKGLVLATIILASIDSPLSSLSTSFVTDIYRPLIRRHGSERHYLAVSRLSVVGFGILLSLIALPFARLDSMLWVAMEVFVLTGGSLLGVFLLGLLTKRRANISNIVFMIFTSLVIGACMVIAHTKPAWMPIGWTWFIGIGGAMTFILSYLFGPALERWAGRRKGVAGVQETIMENEHS